MEDSQEIGKILSVILSRIRHKTSVLTTVRVCSECQNVAAYARQWTKARHKAWNSYLQIHQPEFHDTYDTAHVPGMRCLAILPGTEDLHISWFWCVNLSYQFVQCILSTILNFPWTVVICHMLSSFLVSTDLSLWPLWEALVRFVAHIQQLDMESNGDWAKNCEWIRKKYKVGT